MPTPVLTAGCAACNNLFKVDVNSLFVGITVTQQFITDSQYWFIISFSFPTSGTVIPTFEFTVKIDPAHTYAQHFTSQDLAQQLNGSFSPSSFPTSAVAAPAAATRQVRSFRTGGFGNPMVGGGGAVTSPTSSGPTQDQINQIFG